MKAKIERIVLYCLIVAALLFAPPLARLSVGEDSDGSQSEEDDSWWKDRADTNKDGTVDDEELSAWKDLEARLLDSNRDGKIDDTEKRLAWKYVRTPVVTQTGQDFDSNYDGWLAPEESRMLLFRTVDYVIRTNGSGAIRSKVEEAYDNDDNGVIDLQELIILKEDLR